MKDLQEFFERSTMETLSKLATMLEDENIEKAAGDIWPIIHDIYLDETGVDLNPEDMEDEKVNKLFSDLKISVALYQNVRLGKMVIKKGRLLISNQEEAAFSLTDKGIKSVERLLKK